MTGQSALPDLTVEIAFTPDPMAGYLRAVFTMVANNPSSLFEDITAIDDYVIQPGDRLEYDVWWEGANQQVAIFLTGGAIQQIPFGIDQNGLSAAPATDLSAYANGQWYHRVIDMGSGFTMSKWDIACDKGNLGAGGTFAARFRDIVIVGSDGTVKVSIWRRTDGIPTVAVDTQSPASGNSLALTRVGEAPNWTDITAYVRGVQIRRGKGADLEPTSPGTLTLELQNDDRRFDPSNTASPYYPNVIPGRRVRVTAVKSAVTYRRFTGFIKSVPPQWAGRHGIVTVGAVDAFDMLSAKTISGFRAVEQSGSSTGTLLDNVGALEHIQDVADAELGDFFISGAGITTFRQRTARYIQFSTSQGVYSNAPGVGEFLYIDWTPSFEEDAIFNEVRVRPIAATSDSVASDYDSAAKFSPRTLPRTVWLTTLAEALNQAQFLLAGRKQPALQINSIHLEPKRQDALWAQILARELGDRITVKFQPYGGGVVITEDEYIEEVSETIDCRGSKIDWSFDLSLSPADTQEYWVLGDANNSLLGQTTILGY